MKKKFWSKLSDMFGDVDEELLPFIPDYRINLLAPREITDFTGCRDVYKRQREKSVSRKMPRLRKLPARMSTIRR